MGGFHGMTKDRDGHLGIYYCEHLVTSKCNFNCSFCNSVDSSDDQPLSFILDVIKYLESRGCKFYHITGGEPTVRDDIVDIVSAANRMTVRMSTNGSADIGLYEEIFKAGCRSFAISLHDKNAYVISVIEFLVGIGADVQIGTVDSSNEMLKFISDLGVSDIKIGTISQSESSVIDGLIDMPEHEIMSYRVKRFSKGLGMRGTLKSDKCFLALDDVSIKGIHHYPCAVYIREGGDPIGEFGSEMMDERDEWYSTHSSYDDPICSKYCMDFKCDYNGRNEI